MLYLQSFMYLYCNNNVCLAYFMFGMFCSYMHTVCVYIMYVYMYVKMYLMYVGNVQMNYFFF
jgi:hypothetical protein